jgi:hypothetical protein
MRCREVFKPKEKGVRYKKRYYHIECYHEILGEEGEQAQFDNKVAEACRQDPKGAWEHGL